jgi:hypothetical protein
MLALQFGQRGLFPNPEDVTRDRLFELLTSHYSAWIASCIERIAISAQYLFAPRSIPSDHRLLRG